MAQGGLFSPPIFNLKGVLRLWETSFDLYQYIKEQVQDVYEYVFNILGVEDPDEQFNAGTYVQGTAVAGYYAENGSSYVDTYFSYIMGTTMPVGSTIYTAPWGSCITTAVPSGTALVITPSTGAVTMNVPVIRTNFDDTVSLTAVQIGWNTNQKPLYNAQSRTTPFQGTGNWIGIQQNIDSTNLSGASGKPYYTPLPTGTTTFNDYRQALVIYVNNNNEGLDDITVDDVPTWQELTGEDPTEPTEETTEPATDSNGNVIINNYDTLNIDADISGNADIDFNGTVGIDVSAGAGAFGAGAVVVSGKVDASLNNDGDFVLNADGTLDIAEISLNGDTVTYNQNYSVDSGGTVTNKNITNNYYTIESGVTVELPSYPAIDYDEVLSEREFYDILSTETYDIAPLETDLYSLELQTVPPIEQLPEHLTLTSGAVVSEGAEIIDDLGLSPVYSSLAVFTILCFILRGGR